jgi:hypothetical protein
MSNPVQQSQAEMELQAADEPDDEITSREETELDLMEADASEVGEVIGDETP